MADCIYVGNAPKIAQVITLTFGGTWEVGDLIVFTFGSKVYSYAATSTTIATITAALEVALQALSSDDYPEFGEMTFDSTATTVTLTAATKGKAISPVVTTTESNGDAADSQTLSQSTTTANSGPEDYSNVMNWSGGALPVNSDNVYFDGAFYNGNVLYNLSSGSGVTPTLVKFLNNFSGQIGLPERNATNATEYDEYRTTELTYAGITTLDVDCQSGRIKINGGTGQTLALIRGTGASVDANLPALLWRGTHASNVFEIHGGSAGVALRAADAATILTLRQSGGDLRLGSGVTLTNVDKSGGTIRLESATTTFINDSGDATIDGSGAHASIVMNGGTLNYNSSGTVTAYTGNNDSLVTLDGRNVGRTFTDVTLNDDASWVDTNETVTHTNNVRIIGEVGTRFSAGRAYDLKPVSAV
jgi:hypothetical protein